MEQQIQKEILFYLSDKIRNIDCRTSLSEIQKGRRVLGLCGAMDEIEQREKIEEKPKETFDFLRVVNPIQDE